MSENSLYQTVSEEMFKMLARQLEYSPKAEELPVVVEVMYRDLKALNLHDHDAWRVATAFQDIALNHSRWPTAALVKKHLPDPKPRPALERKRPPMSEVQLEYLRKMGMEKKAGESAADYARRCCRFMLDQLREGEIAVTPELHKAIEKQANAR